MKKLTQKQKKILDIVVMCVEVSIVILAIVLSAIIIANPVSSTAEVAKGKTKLLPVLSDSMAGNNKDSFKAGDLIIATEPKDVYSLEVGQIITFRYKDGGIKMLNTHRIVDIIKGTDGKALTYITHGDHNPEGSTESVNPHDVVAVYKTHLKGVGAAISWLQKPTNFLLVIVLPLALLFIYNIFMFVRMIMRWKVEKAKKEAEEKAAPAIDEEEIKRKAIEEYLAKQQQATESDEKPSDDSADKE